jgi:hypothetical protein
MTAIGLILPVRFSSAAGGQADFGFFRVTPPIGSAR